MANPSNDVNKFFDYLNVYTNAINSVSNIKERLRPHLSPQCEMYERDRDPYKFLILLTSLYSAEKALIVIEDAPYITREDEAPSNALVKIKFVSSNTGRGFATADNFEEMLDFIQMCQARFQTADRYNAE